eukprot:TRINITY_DN42593_c0_g2_i1.p1 TRINITY_DN42593_c0_g2~~TRINITY_DN42593_c0_g2_i1.p1  ORF type:complete len:316 (+),score=47.48 TRINITY_DN42593_c0_g2_i1:56-1003(+)
MASPEVLHGNESRSCEVAVLSFPQWQGEGGANSAGIVRGCELVTRLLQEQVPAATRIAVPCSPPPPVGGALGVNGGSGPVDWHQDLVQQLDEAVAVLNRAQPARIVTAGGDCSTDLAVIGWLAKRYAGDLAVLYVDAHADLNAAEESPSGHFHGMVIRSLLGDAPQGLAPPATLSANSVIYAGLRDLDPTEEVAMKKYNLASHSTAALHAMFREKFAAITEWLQQTGCRHLHIHLDLDVLDPGIFPHVSVPSPVGLQVEHLGELLLAATSAGLSVVGFTVTEARPLQATDDAHCEEVLTALLGEKGLHLARVMTS